MIVPVKVFTGVVSSVLADTRLLQEHLAGLQLGAAQEGERPAKVLEEMNLGGVAKLIRTMEASENSK